MMEKVVRESLDGEEEILEDLLNRILTEYSEDEITWGQFLSFFSKRGKVNHFKDLSISPTKNGLRISQQGEEIGKKIQTDRLI